MRFYSLLLLLTLAACDDSDDATSGETPAFGASEMRSALEGAWTGSLTLDGQATEGTLTLTYQPPASTPQCGTRTLSGGDAPVGASSRCIDVSTMAVTGVLSSQDKRLAGVALTGDYSVFGSSPAQGMVSLKGDTYRVSLQRDADGSLKGTLLRGDVVAGEATLRR